jgi:hypothetical protein
VTFQGAWVGGVVLMNGGVFKRMSKILFGVWYGCRLGGCQRCTLSIYGISREC